jgi:hypothetical protein
MNDVDCEVDDNRQHKSGSGGETFFFPAGKKGEQCICEKEESSDVSVPEQLAADGKADQKKKQISGEADVDPFQVKKEGKSQREQAGYLPVAEAAVVKKNGEGAKSQIHEGGLAAVIPQIPEDKIEGHQSQEDKHDYEQTGQNFARSRHSPQAGDEQIVQIGVARVVFVGGRCTVDDNLIIGSAQFRFQEPVVDGVEMAEADLGVGETGVTRLIEVTDLLSTEQQEEESPQQEEEFMQAVLSAGHGGCRLSQTCPGVKGIILEWIEQKCSTDFDKHRHCPAYGRIDSIPYPPVGCRNISDNDYNFTRNLENDNGKDGKKPQYIDPEYRINR